MIESEEELGNQSNIERGRDEGEGLGEGEGVDEGEGVMGLDET